MTIKKLRCVIVGLGNQAFEHLEAIVNHADVCVVAGVDSNFERHKKAQQLIEDIICFKNLMDLKNSYLDFDAFILALPHNVYQLVWQDIIAFKRPLLKEKPLGRDYQEAKLFMQSAEESGCYLQTAIQRRQHPSYKYLFDYIRENHPKIDEVHAHLHLGKGSDTKNLGWRQNRQQSGGGALLDAGYHLVDLLQYLIGDFEIISATMWNESKADNGEDIEDRSWVFACTPSTWITIDTWVKGLSDNKGGYKKSEMILLNTNQGSIKANREGVWLNEQLLFVSEKQWQQAMIQQLSNFAYNVRNQLRQEDLIWDQLPAMRKIEEAYWLSSRY